ncbi:MBL fold metallo-hydrolase RNA specificity domain-containing protein [Eshraghiella crossota]|jgi:metallo-beta-lactamase family protein|uniref:MBL fold metallo-hydrolase RNA specificity domain-containing protein n=1 Tax=Eshraghiella crossota TaxID=45851 RepID=UPI003AB46FF7
MRLIFIGADHEVTGSCHVLEVCGRYILVDCGMEQGTDDFETAELPMNIADIDYVLLTHAHIDHSGMLPLLYARGFRGDVIATPATVDLCDIMLKDSAHIQMTEAEWKNRKGQRAGKEPVVPIYDMNDAEGVLEHFVSCDYDKVMDLCEGVKVKFSDAGHLLGSASIEVWINEDGEERKIVFSGDIGNLNRPIIKDPSYINDADYVVMESTYGDRYHNADVDYVSELAGICQRTFDRGGNVVIPAFAVGRTQEMLYYFRKIKEEGLVKGHSFEVYVDSPLAVEATQIFNENMAECFDQEAMELVRNGINPLRFPGLTLSITSNDSIAINSDNKPKVIISASGMCEAGRIRHHLKHNLWRKECTIVFVGYQANGTLGRMLLEGASEVKLFGETIEVMAEIVKLEGVSGHADKAGLIKWITSFDNRLKQVFVVHGEDEVSTGFAKCLCDEYGLNAVAPYSGAEFDMISGRFVKEGERIPKAKKPVQRKANDVFERLLAAGRRLLTVIKHNEGGANKDLAKFADQINSMCDKWDR